MLNINNEKDVPEMLKYHRTKDMISLIKFFPELSPIKNLTIIKSIDDYKNNYEFCKGMQGERNDTLITKPATKSIEGDGFYFDIPKLLKKIKEIDSDGVLVLFDLCHIPSQRYERYAGISVNIKVGTDVIIEAVGRGFDGREVSKGIAIHERYLIPWHDLRKLSINNFKDYQTYLVNDINYKTSRNERIAFLNSLGLKTQQFSSFIPSQYEEIPSFIWLDVIKNLLKKLEKMEEELLINNFREFTINGHTEGKRFYPWQMYNKNRYKY